MPILPILPKKSRYKHTPSIGFRRTVLLSIITFATLSGLIQSTQATENTPTVTNRNFAEAHTLGAKTQLIPPSQLSPSLSQATIVKPQAEPSLTPLPPTPTPTLQPSAAGTPPVNNNPWGVAKQVDADTWTMKIGQDSKMATPQEILTALNTYRQRYGSGTLVWDQKLADYANTRATYFTSTNKLDSHAGFLDYVHNQDGFHKLGFASIGENSSIGYTLEGVHLIEWVYAGDKPHNDNQLNPQWQSVGIGVNGSATDLIFASNKI